MSCFCTSLFVRRIEYDKNHLNIKKRHLILFFKASINSGINIKIR